MVVFLQPKDISFVGDQPITRSGTILRRLIKGVMFRKELGDTPALENPKALEEITKAAKS